MLSARASANPPSQKGYCIQPPFLVAPKQPNVLIILDNSGSMNCLAYQSAFDPSQFTSGTYYGYFDPAKNYRYDTSSSTAAAPNRWIPTNAAMNTGTVANPIASGNLLNWITMSRQDIAKKLLIGGRAATGISSAGAYNVADRTTSPVKLYADSDATSGFTCTTNVKSNDGTDKVCSNNNAQTCSADSDCGAGNTCNYLIYPFVGDYKYTVATGDTNTFSIAFNDPSTLKLYPNRNYPGSNPAYSFPAAWVPSTGTLANAYQTIDETTANTTDYITNKTTTEQALFDYDRANAALLAASGTISSVTVHAYAKKTGSTTLNLQAVMWMNIPLLPDSVQPSGLSALTTSFADIPFDYPLNPITGAAWTWDDLTATNSATGPNRLKAFGVQTMGPSNASPTSSLYATVSQVYIQINVSSPPAGGPYKIIVDQGSTPATGILDAMSTEVRFGLAQYNSNGVGGKIADTSATTPTYVNAGNVPNIVKMISNTIGASTTPLAETLYEMERYFRQDSTYYSSADYTKGCTTAANGTSNCTGQSVNTNDPYFYGGSINQYVPCTQSYVLLLTDGESYSDTALPSTTPASPYAPCSLTNIKGCSGAGTLPRPTRYGGTTIGQTYTGSGSDYLIDVAYWGRTNDMRTGATDLPTNWQQGLPKAQNIYLYTVFLFGSGSTLLQDAAIYGGFQDINGNNQPDCTTKPEECYRDSNGDGLITSVRHNFCSNQAPTYATTCLTDADCPAGGTCMDPDSPITYYEGDDGYKLQASITAALTEILKRAASGTAASVLASGQGSGANLLQAIFYPRRSISGQADITWTSTLQNLWYYINPSSASASTIRENTADTGSIYELNLDKDNIINFFFDDTTQMTKANLFADANGDGVADSTIPTAIVDGTAVKNLWEAGLMLWNTSADSRKIYTNVTDTYAATTTAFAGMTEFKTANLTGTTPTLQTLLNTDFTVGTGANQRTAVNNTTVAQNVINYVRGTDISPVTLTTPTETISYRSRSTAVDLSSPPNGTVTDTYTINGVTWSEASKVWKLGDIIDSTPRVASWIPLNKYDTWYGDNYYHTFVGTSTYQGRGMVFTGANDGMLHAFKLGTLDPLSVCKGTTISCFSDADCVGVGGEQCIRAETVIGNIKARLCEDANGNGKCDPSDTTKSNLGKEQWAFIPKSALPYLQYLSRPDYCHLYYVDATPYLFDASIEAPGVHTADYWTQTKRVMCGSNQPCTPANNTLDMANSSWRSILIGGMRLGGACSGPSYCKLIASPFTVTTTICSDDADCATGYSCAKTANTVGAPATNLGYSSYFALDVTDPSAPQLMWEFTNPNLGAASSGAAIVKIQARTSTGPSSMTDANADKVKRNGKWFAVIASGPTGPVGNSLFKGFSNQNLRLFVLDLKTGTLLRTIDTGIANAFGGSMNNATVDWDLDYQDDVLYLGYTKSEDATPSGTTAWTKGGVLRLITREDLSGNDVSTTGNTALNPANWLVTKVVDNIGPVVSAIGHLVHYPFSGAPNFSANNTPPDKAYLYFGSGRYFYPFDDTANQRALYGVVEPCLSKNRPSGSDWTGFTTTDTTAAPVCDDNGGTPVTCITTSTPPAKDFFSPASCLKDATSNSQLTSADAPNGWYINLDTPAGTLFSERVISDPLAAKSGAVFFTTFSPDTDICAYGGSTSLWAVNFATGGSVSSVIDGMGLLQVSTGAIAEVNLGTRFGDKTDVSHKLGRRTDPIPGLPPPDKVSVIVPPSPVDTFVNIRKK